MESKFNEATLKIFKEFAAKSIGKSSDGKEHRPYFSMIQDFNAIVKDLDQAFKWSKALTQELEMRLDSKRSVSLSEKLLQEQLLL